MEGWLPYEEGGHVVTSGRPCSEAQYTGRLISRSSSLLGYKPRTPYTLSSLTSRLSLLVKYVGRSIPPFILANTQHEQN